MAEADFAILDGVAVSFADIDANITVLGGESLKLTGFKEISSKNEIKTENQTAPDGTIVAVTTGIPEPSAAMTLFRNGYQRLKRFLLQYAPVRNGVKRLDLVPFTLTVIHDPPGSTEIYHRVVKGCRLTGSDVKNAQGPGVDEVPVNLVPKKVVDIIDGEEVLA